MKSSLYTPFCKLRSRRRGFLLVEAMISLSILTVIGLVLLKLSMNILAPRQWIMQQTLADAYMSQERATAERIPFATLTGAASPWPNFAAAGATSVIPAQQIGALPDAAAVGRPVFGTVTRTRFHDPNNLPINGGTGTLVENPASMNIWKVQSVLTFRVGANQYVKSRTVLRSQ
jgi:type II secretory pathway pseudopilin PulG